MSNYILIVILTFRKFNTTNVGDVISLERMGKHISNYHLVPPGFKFPAEKRFLQDIGDETNIHVTDVDIMLYSKFNADQMFAYDLILSKLFLMILSRSL